MNTSFCISLGHSSVEESFHHTYALHGNTQSCFLICPNNYFFCLSTSGTKEIVMRCHELCLCIFPVVEYSLHEIIVSR